MTNIALLSFGLVGTAFGRCWKWAADQHLRDELYRLSIELERARARVDRQHTEILTLRRQIAAFVGHPSAKNGWLSGAQFTGGEPCGGDDETLSALVRRQR